jgi:dCTP deaminase
VQLFTGLEADCFTGGDADFSPGAGVTADAGFARPDAEDAEAAEFDAIAAGEGVFQPFEHCIHGGFRLGPRQACPLDDVVDNILLDQSRCPFVFNIARPAEKQPTGRMLLPWRTVVNLGVVQYHKQLRQHVSARLDWNAGAWPRGAVRRERKARIMSIKSDRWIREQALQHGMIEPFSEKQVREGVISYGLSSYGYDLRVSDEFKIFTNVNSAIIDPKAFDERSFVSVQAESVIVPPNSFALARSVEYFRIPRDVISICVGKSTYARCGIIVNVTPFEPEWEGYVTLEISNTTPLPARVYANEGLCQILFFQGDEPCEVSYADRKGKYQKQQGIVLPRL